MALGPIEVLVVGFPGNQFNGEIIPELERLVGSDTITIVDALLVTKEADGSVTLVELAEDEVNPDVARLMKIHEHLDDIISDEDVVELVADLGAGNSAAILVFEHTWAKPLQEAIVGSGGLLLDDFRIPGSIVEELLAELS